MPKSPELSEDNIVSLSRSWLEFADISVRGSSRKDDYYRLKWDAAENMEDDVELLLRRVNAKKEKLKIELLGEIRSGVLIAHGRDISKGVNSPHELLVGAYFDEMHSYFQPDWDNNTVTIHGQKFADVVVSPVPGEQNQLVPQPPSKMGRPSSEGVEAAIKILDAADPRFRTIGRKPQCDRVRIHLFGDGVDHVHPPKGYKDGAIKLRLRELLPS